jgi:hypothetical protein
VFGNSTFCGLAVAAGLVPASVGATSKVAISQGAATLPDPAKESFKHWKTGQLLNGQRASKKIGRNTLTCEGGSGLTGAGTPSRGGMRVTRRCWWN